MIKFGLKYVVYIIFFKVSFKKDRIKKLTLVVSLKIVVSFHNSLNRLFWKGVM